MPRSSKWFLSFSFPCQHLVHISLLLMHATYLTHLIFFHLITVIIIFGEEDKSSFPLCNFLQSLVNFSLSGPNIFPNLCSFLSLWDRVSHPYKINKTAVLLSYLHKILYLNTNGILCALENIKLHWMITAVVLVSSKHYLRKCQFVPCYNNCIIICVLNRTLFLSMLFH